MKVEYLQEPELEFGTGKHIDIRFGLMNYGPLDFERQLAPKLIKVGIVGTPETIEGVQTWLERCRSEIHAKTSRQPNLFPGFPGFHPDASFRASVIMDPQLQREISPRLFDNLGKHSKADPIVTEAAELFLSELSHLAEKVNSDVFICAPPMTLLTLLEERSQSSKNPEEEVDIDEENPINLDFHHLLKPGSCRLESRYKLSCQRLTMRANTDSRRVILKGSEGPKMRLPEPGISIPPSIIKQEEHHGDWCVTHQS